MRKTILSFLLLLLTGFKIAYGQGNYDFSSLCSTGQTLFYQINTDNTSVTVVPPDYYGWYDSDYQISGNITIPSSVSYGGSSYNVTAIGDEAFYDCWQVDSVSIPNSVTSIGAYAFSGTNISYLRVPNSVVTIGECAFPYIFNVEYHGIATGSPWCARHVNAYFDGDFVYADSTKTVLTDYTGNDTTVVIPSTVTTIGAFAFQGNGNVVSVSIPNSVTTIGEQAFSDCYYLSTLTIPSSVTSIGSYAFSGCWKLSPFFIPSSVATIGECAFYGIFNVEYHGTATGSPWCARCVNAYIDGDFVYADSTKTELVRYIGNDTSIVIPSSVTTIGYQAFGGAGIISVLIPNSVTTIAVQAFSGCGSLTSVTSNSVTTIEEYAFNDCSSLTSVSFDTVITIGSSAFYNCSSLTSVSFNSVTTIGSYAFSGCSSLTSVSFNSVTTIGDGAFSGCSSLTSVSLNSVTTIGRYAFSGCGSLTSVTSNSVTTIEEYAFNDCSSLTSVSFDTVITIGSSAFYNCSSLTSVSFNSVTTIGSYAFSGCSSLTSVSFNSVTTIGNSAFRGCSTLASISIPDSVTRIEGYTFYGCSSLVSVTLGKSVSYIGSAAFKEDSALDTIIVLNTNEIPEMEGYWNSYYDYDIHDYSIYASWTFPFSNDMRQVTVVVPCHTYNDYLNHAWSFFENITEADSCVEYDFWAISPSYDTLYYRIMDSNNVMVIHPRADREWRGVTWPVGELIIPEMVEHNGTTYTVSSIGDMGFAYDTAITSLSLPHTLTSVGSGAFAFCKQLDSVYYDANITSYYWSRADIFYMDTNITSITIGNHAKAIPFGMFGDNGGASHNLSSLILGDSLVTIGDYAFSGMSRIDTLRIPNSVITIGNGAFQGAHSNYGNRTDQLKAVIIGSGVDTIGTTAFALHYNVDSIVVLNENSRFDSRGGCNAIVETATNRLILGCQTTEIPNNVTAIGPYAFYGCQHLTSLTIPDSVSLIDEYAFSDCYGLNIIDLSSSTPPEVYWSSFDYSIRQNTPVTVPCGSILTYISSNWGQLFSTIVERSGCTPSVWYDFWAVSPSGDTLYYKIKDSTSVAVVHPLENNYNTERSYWAGFTQPSGSLIIPDRVENEGVNYRVSAVWDETFKGNSSITSITIPSYIDSLGQHAFAQCGNLDTIHYNADSCIYLNGYSTFEEDSISTLYIGQNVRWLRESLFSFLNNQSDSITLYFNAVASNSYPYYFSSPFSELPITSLYIGNNVRSIPNRFFYGCDRITSITLPDSLRYIGTSAFEGCNSLATLTIPESVEHIGSNAFHNCNRLTSLNYNAKNCNTDNSWDIFTFDTTLVTIDTVFFFDSLYDDGRDLWYYCYNNYDVGERCVYHEYGCWGDDNFCSRWFYFDEYPTIVYMDNNYYISQYCEDEDCQYISYDTIYFYDEYYDDYRGLSYCYYYDRQLFHDEYGYYGEYGWFYEEYERHYLDVDYFVNRQTDNTTWSNVSTLNIGSQVETIPSGIFSRLKALHSVEIPESVRTISNYSFSGSGLTSIAIPNTVQHLGNGVFENCASLATATLPNHLDTIPAYTFSSCESLTDYIFSDSTVYIGESSFRNCTSLTSVVVPDSVTTIGDEAFSGCTGLTLATIGRNVANIGSSAFANCTNLDTVNYNALNCSSRDWYYNRYDYMDVFYNSGISVLNIGESVHTIPNCIFRGCSNIDRITIPDSVSSIGSYSFYGCTGVSTLSIGKRVSGIGLYAFDGCSEIDTIFLHPNVPPSIESNSFNGVGYYVPVYVPCHTLSTYTASTNWNSRFGNILEENCDYPDLQVTGIVLPDSIVSCSDLQVLATITNEGTYRVRTNGWYDELYISHLPTFDSSAIRLARMRHNNASNMLQPDSSYTVTFLGQIPHLWIGETYFYIATAVGFDETELDTTNNVTTSVMRTVLLPDIVHPDIVVWDTACVQYTWNGHTYDTSGLYTYVHEYDDSPCHNTDTLHLKIWPTYNIHQYVSIADTTSYSFCGHEYSQTGVYSEEMLSIHGCDSVQTLHLQVLPIRRPIVTVSVCQGTPYNGNRARFNLSGSETADTIGLLVLRDTIRSSHGLDSVIFGVDLTVLPVNLSAATGMMPAADSIIEHGDVTLSWNAVEGATGYMVYLWDSTQAMPTNPSYTTNNTYWNTPSCENQQTYFWKVEAYNPCDTMASETHSFSINILPTVTTLPVVQATVCQGLPYNGGRDRFQIPASVTADTLGLMELRDTAITSMGYETVIYGVDLTVLSSNLPAATGMMPAADSVITHGGVALRWQAVEGADGYRVYLWDSESTMPTMPTHTTSNTYWNVPTYENRHTYSWKVEAYNSCDTSTSDIHHFFIYKQPTMTADRHAIDFGEVEYGQTLTQRLFVSGKDLTDSIRFALRGSDTSMFSLSSESIGRLGGNINVSFTPIAMQQEFSAFIVVTGGGVPSDTIQLSGSLANYYVFNISLPDTILQTGLPVPITGTLTNAIGIAQTGVAVDIYIKVMGHTTLIADTTDSIGHFEAIYLPRFSESGNYKVGACLHGEGHDKIMEEFDIPGISILTNSIVWNVEQNDTITGSIAVKNRCGITLQNIAVTADSIPTGMDILFSPLTLGAFEEGEIHYTLVGRTLSPSLKYENASFSISSSVGSLLSPPFDLGRIEALYYCQKPVPDLQISFDTIECAIVPGTQKVIDVALYNNTDSVFREVRVATPSGLTSIKPLNGDSSYSIEPHDTLFVPLLVMFPEETPLVPVAGTVLVTATETQPQLVPFSIQLVTEATGSLSVLVSNEYTYEYGNYVSGANVSVVGYYSLDTVASGVTGSNGLLVFDSLPEGYYHIYVEAPENSPYTNIIRIRAGEHTFVDADLEYDAIRYEWVIIEDDVEDSYRVVMNTEFKTNVPKPVITIENTTVNIPPDGSFGTFNMVVTNHGLIDAFDITIHMPTSSNYEYIALFDKIDTIHALSSVTIPCSVRNKAIADSVEHIRSRGHYGVDTLYNVTPRKKVNVVYYDTIIYVPVSRNGIDSNGVDLWNYDTMMVSVPHHVIDTVYDSTLASIVYYDSLSHEVLLDIVINSPTGLTDSTKANRYYASSKSWDDEKSILDDCHTEELSISVVISHYKCNNQGVKTILSEKTLTSPQIKAKACPDLLDKIVDQITDVIKKIPIRIKVPPIKIPPLVPLVTPDPCPNCYPTVTPISIKGWECMPCWAKAAAAAAQCAASGFNAATCAINAADALAYCIGGGIDIQPGVSSKGITDTEIKSGGSIVGAGLNAHHSTNNSVEQDVDIYARNIRIVKQYYDYLREDWHTMVNDTLPVFRTNPEVLEQIVEYLETTDSATVQGLAHSYDNLTVSIDSSTLLRYAERWNRTLKYRMYGWTDPSLVPEGFSTDFYYPENSIAASIASLEDTARILGFESVYELYSATIESMLSARGKQSQCASVSLQLGQDIAMTREAFTGTLTISNSHDSIALHNLKTLFSVSDTLGHDCSDKFDISIMKQEGVDTTSQSISAGERGTITVRFVPLMSAAPTDTTPYLFGGTIKYISPYTSDTVFDELYPVRLLVTPSPHLQLDYFIPHDIIADNPLTSPMIEATVPATIGLRVKNDGMGAAKNVRLSTIQPQITENRLGLAVDFWMLNTMRNGVNQSQPLSDIAINLVQPNETHTMEYYLMSSLLGTLTVKDINVIHNSSIDDKDMSLVDARAHRLVKPILQYGPGVDSIHDFLTDDVANGYNIPDSIFFSDGSATRVHETANTLFNHYVAPNDTMVQVTLYPDTLGWNYGETDDPGKGKYEIVSCIRDDNTEIPLENIWLTFVDLPTDEDPVYVNKMHLVDTLHTARPTVYNVTFRLKSDMLEVDTIALLPLSDPEASLDSFMVVFNKPIIDSTFSYADMSLKCNNGIQLMDNTVPIRRINDSTFSVDVSHKTTAVGLYVLKVMADSIMDAKGHYGNGGKEIHWVRTSCNPNIDNTTVAVCESYLWRNRLLTQSGVYFDTVSVLNDCDSIYVLTLTIKHNTVATETVTACDSYTWHDSTYTVSTFNSQFSTLNSVGCDSTITLHLTINNSTTGIETVTACDSYNWHDSLYTVSTLNSQFSTLNSVGCDSVTTLHLTINYSTTSTESVTACDSYTWHDSVYTASTLNSQFSTLNSVGCDSVTTLHLTINYSTTSTESVTACDSYTWHDSVYTASTLNSQFSTLNSVGCDSTVTLHLTINYSDTTHAVGSICEGDSLFFNGNWLSTEGTYHHTLQDAYGCDSVIILMLTVNPTSETIITDTACDSYTWHDSVYTASSIDSITSTNSQGCDSTVTLHLTINYSTHDTIVDSAAGSYTWNGNTYTESGEYLFEGQTEAGCDSVILLQLTITEVGIGTADNLGHITLSPNPTTGKITITPSEVDKVEVYDQSGRIVAIFHDSNVINIRHLPTGVYTLRITLHNGNAIKRVIKQ